MIKSTSISALLVFALWSGTAIGPVAAQTKTPKHGGTLIFAMGSDAGFTNRNTSAANPDGLIGCMIYQGLTNVDRDGKIYPLLAKSWTISDDSKTYTFELNKADFSDGKPFTSEDVKYTLLEVSVKYSNVFASVGRMIEAIDTPAPDRVIIRLKQPYGPLLLSLACVQGGAIMPAHLMKGTDVLRNPIVTTAPVGTGPFVLAEWKRGESITMKRNPRYWEPGKPYLDQVIAKVIPQASSRTQALMSGEVDFVSHSNLPVSDYPIVRSNPALTQTPQLVAPANDIMFVNVTHKPLDDRRVRQALFMGIDREYLVKNVYRAGSVGTMPFNNRILWAANPDIDFRSMYPFDPARANALLDEVGLKRGANGMRFQVKMVYPTDDNDAALVATAVKSMWRDIGVDMNIAPAERVVAAKMMYETLDYDVSQQGLQSFFDPALGIAPWYTTEGLKKLYSNASGYSNPEVDALFAKGETGATLEERGKAYKEVQVILAKDLPLFVLHEKVQFDSHIKEVVGFEEQENSLISWRNGWLDQ